MVYLKVIILALVIIFSTQAIDAKQISQREKIYKIAQAFYKRYHHREYFSALAITVSTDEEPFSIYIGTVGHHQSALINEKSLFQIGSITKSYIAALLVQLETEGKCHLNDSISNYFPQYKKMAQHISQELIKHDERHS